MLFLKVPILVFFCVSVARWGGGVRSVEQSVMNGRPGIWHRNTHARKRTSTLRNTGGRQAGMQARGNTPNMFPCCYYVGSSTFAS